jgi:hypothetical protein
MLFTEPDPKPDPEPDPEPKPDPEPRLDPEFTQPCVTVPSNEETCCHAQEEYVAHSPHFVIELQMTSVQSPILFINFVRVLAPFLTIIQFAKSLGTNGFPAVCGIHASTVPSFTPANPFTGSA